MMRLDVVQSYVESVLHLPKVKPDEYDNYTTLLQLLRQSSTKKEVKVAMRFLEEKGF